MRPHREEPREPQPLMQDSPRVRKGTRTRIPVWSQELKLHNLCRSWSFLNSDLQHQTDPLSHL